MAKTDHVDKMAYQDPPDHPVKQDQKERLVVQELTVFKENVENLALKETPGQLDYLEK